MKSSSVVRIQILLVVKQVKHAGIFKVLAVVVVVVIACSRTRQAQYLLPTLSECPCTALAEQRAQ